MAAEDKDYKVLYDKLVESILIEKSRSFANPAVVEVLRIIDHKRLAAEGPQQEPVHCHDIPWPTSGILGSGFQRGEPVHIGFQQEEKYETLHHSV